MKLAIILLIILAALFAVGIIVGFSQPEKDPGKMTLEKDVPSWIKNGVGGLFGGFQDKVDLRRLSPKANGQYSLSDRTLTLKADSLTLQFTPVEDEHSSQGARLKWISGPALRVLYIDRESDEEEPPVEKWPRLPPKNGDSDVRIAVRSVGGKLKMRKIGNDTSEPSRIKFE